MIILATFTRALRSPTSPLEVRINAEHVVSVEQVQGGSEIFVLGREDPIAVVGTPEEIDAAFAVAQRDVIRDTAEVALELSAQFARRAEGL